MHKETGKIDLTKLEVLVREISDIRNQGRDVILVSSGAIAVGRTSMGLSDVLSLKEKQACAAIGQAKLMMIYQKLFAEYGQTAAQILMTKNTMVDTQNRMNAKNTFEELFALRAVPVVNENDTIATYEIEFGDNDTLSAVVSALVGADLLILLSDIDGLYSDDPRRNGNARFIPEVTSLTEDIRRMAKKSTGSGVGTGGMATKLHAAEISMESGCDMVIANAKDFHVIHRILNGLERGTIFTANPSKNFKLVDYLEKL